MIAIFVCRKSCDQLPMAPDHHSSLLSSTGISKTQSASLCCPLFSKQYKTTCITTKSGLFVLFAVAIISGTGAVIMPMSNEVLFLTATASLSLTLLMSPLLDLWEKSTAKDL